MWLISVHSCSLWPPFHASKWRNENLPARVTEVTTIGIPAPEVDSDPGLPCRFYLPSLFAKLCMLNLPPKSTSVSAFCLCLFIFSRKIGKNRFSSIQYLPQFLVARIERLYWWPPVSVIIRLSSNVGAANVGLYEGGQRLCFVKILNFFFENLNFFF